MRLFVLFSAFVLFFGVYSYMVGFHNVDICHNEKDIENMVNNIFTDRGLDRVFAIQENTLDGQRWDLDVCYINGLNQMNRGFFIAIIGSLLFGITLYGGE